MSVSRMKVAETDDTSLDVLLKSAVCTRRSSKSTAQRFQGFSARTLSVRHSKMAGPLKSLKGKNVELPELLANGEDDLQACLWGQLYLPIAIARA